MTTITGILIFFSETGTEGGWWAIQDENFIKPAPDPTDKACQVCGRIWVNGLVGDTPEPAPMFTYYRETFTVDGTKGPMVEVKLDHPVVGGQTHGPYESEGSFNDEWNKRANELNLKCREEGHVWEVRKIHPQWAYEGLHYISNGDLLEILDASGEVVKTIDVKLQTQDPYDARSYAAGKFLAAHQRPLDIDPNEWESYFFPEETRARLTKRRA